MGLIVAIAGSPTAGSRSLALARRSAGRLTELGHEVAVIDFRTLPPHALLRAETSDPELAEAIALVGRADGVIVTTPVYKAAYTGTLKAFLDLLPYLGLAGKGALPIVSAKLPDHALALDTALAPVLAALDASFQVRGVFALDSELVRTADGDFDVAEPLAARLDRALEDFVAVLEVRARSAAAGRG